MRSHSGLPYRLLAGLLMSCLSAVCFVGCNSGSRDGFGSNIPGVTFSARPLADDHEMYVTDGLGTPRYSHTATVLDDGRVLVVGGTEENHVEGLATAEVFDQSAFSDTPPLPASQSGVWFTRDFSGEPIEMNEARILHTATKLPDGNVLICGGVPDRFSNTAVEDAEIFDVQKRNFGLDNEDDPAMVTPRFRHTATLMPNGKVLIVGGQEAASTTILLQNGATITILSYPSLDSLEVFDPVEVEFSEVLDQGGDPTRLKAAPNGRFGHSIVRIAGPDNRYDSSDDVAVVCCGSRTLSGQFATNTIGWGNSGNATIDGIEYYDPVSRSTQVAPAVVTTGRNNGVRAINLGALVRGETPDGVKGVDNVFLVTHGDDDETVQTSRVTDQVYAVTFTGVGAVGGIAFAEIQPDEVDGWPHYNINLEHNRVFQIPPCQPIGISFSDPQLMKAQRLYGDTVYDSNWVVSIAGVHLFVDPAGAQGELYSGTGCGNVANEIRGVRFFDPFWNINNVDVDIDGNPAGPWDLRTSETEQNPTGVVGTWILGHERGIDDGTVFGIPGDPSGVPPALPPEDPYEEYSEGFVASVEPDSSSTLPDDEGRVWHTLTPLPGFDGVLNTADDRILITGGGAQYAGVLGGQARSRSAVIYLPPNASFNVPD